MSDAMESAAAARPGSAAAAATAAAADDLAAAPPCRTLAIIKPDAVAAGKADEILHIAELAGFTVIQQQRVQLTAARAEAFYADHRERAFFPGLVEFMTSGPIVAAVLARPDAVRAWRELIGPTNSLDARVRAPKSLRALYGTNGTRNAVHGSDSATSAAREARFFFPDLLLEGDALLAAGAAPSPEAVAAYVQERLRLTLEKALTALAKAKPSSEPAEALTFVAQFLLDNNPNKPRKVVPGAALAEAARAAAAAAARAQQLQQRAGEPATAAPGELRGPAGRQTTGERRAAQDGAATKVQAAFRGHQARQQVAGMRSGS